METCGARLSPPCLPTRSRLWEVMLRPSAMVSSVCSGADRAGAPKCARAKPRHRNCGSGRLQAPGRWSVSHHRQSRPDESSQRVILARACRIRRWRAAAICDEAATSPRSHRALIGLTETDGTTSISAVSLTATARWIVWALRSLQGSHAGTGAGRQPERGAGARYLGSCRCRTFRQPAESLPAGQPFVRFDVLAKAALTSASVAVP